MSNSSALKQLAKYFKPYKWQLVGVFIALCFTSTSVLVLGQAIKSLIDKGLGTGNLGLLNQSLSVLIIIIFLLAIATFVRAYLINSVSEQVVNNIRKDVYRHVIKLDVMFFEMHKTSDTISRLIADCSVLNNVIGSVLSSSLRNIIMLIGGSFLMVTTSPKLTSYVIILIPLVLIPIVIIGKKVRKHSKLAQADMANFSCHIEETINAIKTVQAFNQQSYEINLFEDLLKKAKFSSLQWIKLRGILVATVIMMVFLAIVIVLWLGGKDLINNNISAGALSSFIFYSIVVASSIGALSEIVGDYQRALGAAERLFELTNVESSIVETEHLQISPIDNVKDLCFKQVSFSYPARSDFNVLIDFNLSIKAGEKIAIVGPSGAGKTTLFQLLLRFYDAQTGEIIINGVNIRNLTTHNLRNMFAIVAQDPVIFSATAYENILYGNMGASLEQVITAAKQAEIYEFLESLPLGINSFLGEKGVRISGGQKQRIAIARAIIKNPQILLLDEATSSLDNQNEKIVQQALEKLMHGRTTIIIAHRLSTIINCDRIILLNKGKIEAIGSHSQLYEQSELYRSLATLNI